MRKLRHYLCRHDFEYLGQNLIISERLYHCRKCGLYKLDAYILGLQVLTTSVDWQAYLSTELSYLRKGRRTSNVRNTRKI